MNRKTKREKQNKEWTPKEFRTSDGRLAIVPFVNTEARGAIGRKAQLEIEKIRMSREERAEAAYLEEQAVEVRWERQMIKATEAF